MKKKIIRVILMATVVTSLYSKCYAAESVSLTTSDFWKNSSAIKGRETEFNGYTSKNNPRAVWSIAEYKDSIGWHYNTKKKIKAGKNCPTLSSDKLKRCKWRLQLNPYGTDTSGCIANGSIWVVSK